MATGLVRAIVVTKQPAFAIFCLMAPPGTRRLPFRIWVPLGLGLGLLVMSLLIWQANQDKALVALALSGFCIAIVAWTTKLRSLRRTPRSTIIAHGVPLRPLRGQLFFVSMVFAIPGAAIVLLGGRTPLSVQVIGWGLALVGCALAAAVIARLLPTGYVQFAPEGITFGKRTWRYLVPWRAITRVRADELGELPVLYFSLRDPSCVVVHPPTFQLRAARELARNQRWVGAHVMLMPQKYGLDLLMVLKTVREHMAPITSTPPIGYNRAHLCGSPRKQ